MKISDIVDAPMTAGADCRLVCSACEDHVSKVWQVNSRAMCRNCVGAWIDVQINDEVNWAFEQAACVAFNKTQDEELYEIIKLLKWPDGKRPQEKA